MRLPVLFRPEARNDVQEIIEYLEQVGQAHKFLERLRTAIDRIEHHPELYGIVWKSVRAVRLRKFLYVMHYVVRTDRIEVLAVIHGSRHESEWQSRV